MSTRRQVLAGFAAGLAVMPVPGWSKIGEPALLTAGRRPDGSYMLCGLRQDGSLAFEIELPDRGHAAALHPTRLEAIAFARRPGVFAVVIDCCTGAVAARLDAPPERHFYGHGVYSRDGSLLYTTENAYELGAGRVGVWDVQAGYRRIGEFSSHGIGPHDLRRLPERDVLVVANGGIETHPASGRAKLNLPMMRPNLTYLDAAGHLLEQVEPPAEWHQNSIRHLAIRADGLVALATQWQGALADTPPLLALHRQGSELQWCAMEEPASHHRLQGYGGSIAFSEDGERVAISSPRGNCLQVFEVDRPEKAEHAEMLDICGITGRDSGFFATSGQGIVGEYVPGQPMRAMAKHSANWDNHLIGLNRLGL
ncbi:MAG: DUF1513 domain-containing protein [Mangrovicoccus sp.]|nr:DUF1513 domain-containing protein [Mangrovicoccus sp.]